MCGIIVDMTIINILIRNYFPKLIPLLDNKNENYGDYIGNNFINVNLINLFTNEYINENTSLLIWDLLFIDGNIILIKTFLAIYHYLLPFLLESNQTIEDYQLMINDKMKKLESDNKELIFYLVIKEYNFTEEGIEQVRFSLSVNTANSITKERNAYPAKKEKNIECDINWPICRKKYLDNENHTNIVFVNVMQTKNKNFIDDYFVQKMKNRNNNNEEIINDETDILIERHAHCCMENKNNNEKEEVKNTIEENKNGNKEKKEEIEGKENDKEINYNKIINKPEFIEASKKVLNNLKIKLKPDDKEGKKIKNSDN